MKSQLDSLLVSCLETLSLVNLVFLPRNFSALLPNSLFTHFLFSRRNPVFLLPFDDCLVGVIKASLEIFLSDARLSTIFGCYK